MTKCSTGVCSSIGFRWPFRDEWRWGDVEWEVLQGEVTPLPYCVILTLIYFIILFIYFSFLFFLSSLFNVHMSKGGHHRYFALGGKEVI